MQDKAIGIVAISPEGAALFYRELTRQLRKTFGQEPLPPVAMHGLSLTEYIERSEARDWHGVAAMLSRSAKALAAMGASFCVTPDHIVQHGLHLMEGASPIPWLSMSELVAGRLRRDEIASIGVLGTREAMFGSTYQTVLGMRGIKVHAPDEQDATTLDRIVFKELIYGISSDEARTRVNDVADRLVAKGAEAILVASSELPLVLNRATCDQRLYDAAELLAEGAAMRVFIER